MKHPLRILASVAILGFAASLTQAQPTPKIFVIDMAKIYETHYKTEEHNAKLKGDEQKAQVELERLNKEGTALVNEFTALQEQAKNNPLASNEAKAKAEQEAQAKLEDIEKKKQEIQVFRQTVQQQLGQRLRSFREVLLDEISKTATDIAKKRGGNVLIDKSGPSGYGIPNFIYVDSGFDITDDVIKEVNKDRPASAPAPAATAGATKAPAASTPAPSASEGPSITFPGAKKN